MAPLKSLLMRHAEKPEEPSDPHLSPEGEDRAKRLATWVPRQLGGPPDFIFAAANSEESDRPVETVTPLLKQSTCRSTPTRRISNMRRWRLICCPTRAMKASLS